jgi:maltose O-acetyltransferase
VELHDVSSVPLLEPAGHRRLTDFPLRELAPHAWPALRGTLYLRTKATTVVGIPRIRGTVRVINRGQLHIGPLFSINGFPVPCQIHVAPGGYMGIGDHVFINHGADIYVETELTMGDNVRIGPLCALVDSNFHAMDLGHEARRGPIHLGPNVWLARQSIVLPGVSIGAGTVVAAASVVTKDLPAHVLAAGTPARVVREIETPNDWVRDDGPAAWTDLSLSRRRARRAPPSG